MIWPRLLLGFHLLLPLPPSALQRPSFSSSHLLCLLLSPGLCLRSFPCLEDSPPFFLHGCLLLIPDAQTPLSQGGHSDHSTDIRPCTQHRCICSTFDYIESHLYLLFCADCPAYNVSSMKSLVRLYMTSA